jgi:signal transduction histidine kinase/CHASE3 domain sensor protein/DNA-binding NarL/FixJ family response regulator
VTAARAHSLVHVGYGAAAVVFVLLALGVHQASRQREASTGWVDHTLRVLALASGVGDALGRAEAANRGFVLSGDGEYLPERDAALAAAARRLEELERLTADNPAQQQRVRRLEALQRERSALMSAAEAARRDAATARVRDLVTQGRSQGAAVHRLVDEMRADEQRLLDRRRAEQEAGTRTDDLLSIGAIVAAFAIMVPAYLGFRREARARARAEGSLVTLAESLPVAVFQYRKQPGGPGRFDFVTASTGRVCGVAASEALRNPNALLDNIVQSDRGAYLEALADGERTLGPMEVDYRVRLPDGNLRWIRASASPRREADGCVVWSGLWSDVTERKALDQQLRASREAAEEASRAKSTFLATMSHEIRTPMNGVLGMLELLSHTRMEPEQRASVTVIRESAHSLLRIIDDILDISRIEAGKLELRPEPASPAALVERVRGIYAGNASSKGIALGCSVDARISPALWFDPVRVQQILGNLVSNAIKFTDKGSVHVRAELADRVDGEEVVRFSVADTGVGISNADKGRLFEPFSQARETAGSRPGTGLGLSICKRLAAMMEGAIDMQSEPGRGTTVFLTLRMALAPEAAIPADAATPAAGARHDAAFALAEDTLRARAGLRVLVVDDHRINRLVLERQVAALGYAAESAVNGTEAFEKWRGGGLGAVVTDCNMPGMDGYQLTRRIREAEATQGLGHTPVIACTANAIVGEAEKCLAVGMDDYLPKPVDLRGLERKLAQWIAVPAPVDAAVVSQISGGDREVESEVMRRFQQCHEGDVQALRESVRAADFDAVAGASHRIKGATRTIGALDLASACEAIERAARERDAVAIAAQMPRFEAEDARLGTYLRAVLR